MREPSRVGEKKRRTRERILANAIALFRHHGIRKTRLAEIASASDLAPATVFTHFQTKSDLAEAWVRGEVESILAEAIRDAVERERSFRSAVRAACRLLAESAGPESALRLEAWRLVGRAGALDQVGEVARAGLIAGVKGEQARDHLRADLPAAVLAAMLSDAIEGGLVGSLEAVEAADATGFEEDTRRIGKAIQTQVDLMLDGARKRNERVRPPARNT